VDRFYRKFLDRVFNQVFLHKISECMWNNTVKALTLPSSQSEMSDIADFKHRDWVRNLVQEDQSRLAKKKHVNPNLVFPFQDDFSVGSNHGLNVSPMTNLSAPTASKIIKIQDDNYDISVLTTNTSSKLRNPPLDKWRKPESVFGTRVASSSDPILISGPTADTTPTGVDGQAPTASEGSSDSPSTGTAGRVDEGPSSK
jgi:hypothetical protein